MNRFSLEDEKDENEENHCSGKELRTLLFLGIFLRVIVFIFQHPFNNDNYFEVVEFVFRHHILPVTGLMPQSQHPPLYFIIASLFLFFGREKMVQLFSLLLSIGTLAVIYRLIKEVEFIQPLRVKKYCLSLACFLPQFVMFGNFISNDSLTFLIGALIFLQIHACLENPGTRTQDILAVYLGIGLLTKIFFLPFVAVLILLVVFINFLRGARRTQIGRRVFIFVLISLLIGSYKFTENMIYHRNPFIHTLDFSPEWAQGQRPTYRGLSSFYDINVLKLIKEPTISDATRHSFPLMLYGTMWYQYLPVSNFRGNVTRLKYLGSAIYLLALLPMLLFAVGLFRILFSFPALLHYKALDGRCFNRLAYEAAAIALLFLCFLVVIGGAVKYDIWSFLQSKYFFVAFFSFIVLLNSGLEYVNKKDKRIQGLVYCTLCCLFVLFVVYFLAEILFLFVH